MSLARCNAAATSFLGLPRPLGRLRYISASSTESKWSGAGLKVEDFRLRGLGVGELELIEVFGARSFITGMTPIGDSRTWKANGLGARGLGGVFELGTSVDGIEAIASFVINGYEFYLSRRGNGRLNGSDNYYYFRLCTKHTLYKRHLDFSYTSYNNQDPEKESHKHC